jgi:hypothetical protein
MAQVDKDTDLTAMLLEDDPMDMIPIFALVSNVIVRSDRQFRERMKWENHVEELFDEGPLEFAIQYRMSYKAFMGLCAILEPIIKSEKDSKKQRDYVLPVSIEIKVHCLICWLAGGSYSDIRVVAGCSRAAFYQYIYECVDAIILCPQLAYHFPTSNEEISKAASDFEEISYNDAIKGCVACIDGFLLRIKVPARNETGNVKAYFSGHYQAYGVNIQAACDSKCRFVEVGVVAPGGTNDIAAFRKTKLSKLINKLPIGKFVIGDNAYICSEHLLTPFSGPTKMQPKRDAYNFYVSQLRIRIEQAFGFMTQKWQILRRPLQIKLKNVSKVFLAITRLHNYCINKDEAMQPVIIDDALTGEHEELFFPQILPLQILLVILSCKVYLLTT